MAGILIQTAQVTELAGITGEQLRYWKGALRPIAKRDGRKKGYSFAELVAIAAIGEAMAQFSLDISRFQESAEDFFAAVEAIVREQQTPGMVYLSGDQVSVGEPFPQDGEVALVFQINRLARRLREQMTSAPPPAQFSLI
ncbi:hypothetical protein [Sphingosinithalassobacter sp. CS137]|uniref:hypothetical protein n=1 Tax=Sphingosinithalassobacter sp. CS137 TaxID=2762748 RepID=UPI00165DC218|nr:hypothetical protein [Sphingosinithalassobacter sp. CS137]